MKVEWSRLKNYPLSWKRVTTVHEVPVPREFKDSKRSYHRMVVDDGNLVAKGETCCDNRQYGCAYLGSCTAQPPQDIPLGRITDYPIDKE